jgi:hypothetical protein
MKKSINQPYWKTIERIITSLEKILTPDAKVEHDVRLPVIGSLSKRKRQCDVVITYEI